MSKDGGPAFPIVYKDGRDGIEQTEFGMTLRDYFAAAVFPEMLRQAYKRDRGDNQLATAVTGSFVVADAMLAERDREKG